MGTDRTSGRYSRGHCPGRAYLSALKTHLPIGPLEHSIGGGRDRRRAGVHLITPPVWEHGAYLPNPIGAATSLARCGQAMTVRPAAMGRAVAGAPYW